MKYPEVNEVSRKRNEKIGTLLGRDHLGVSFFHLLKIPTNPQFSRISLMGATEGGVSNYAREDQN